MANPVRWEVVVARLNDLNRLLDEEWEPFAAGVTSGPQGLHFVYLRRQKSK
jgi:hypothetical protein